MDHTSLLQQFYDQGGQAVERCIQCGTCSGSCPLAQEMRYGPRALFDMLRSRQESEIEEALTSRDIWLCVSCYQCQVRCPQEIPVTDLVYALKRLATAQGIAPRGAKTKDLYAAFMDVARKHGRVTDGLIMARYSTRHPDDALRSLPLALGLLRRKRLDTEVQKVADPAKWRELLAESKNRQGKEEGE